MSHLFLLARNFKKNCRNFCAIHFSEYLNFFSIRHEEKKNFLVAQNSLIIKKLFFWIRLHKNISQNAYGGGQLTPMPPPRANENSVLAVPVEKRKPHAHLILPTSIEILLELVVSLFVFLSRGHCVPTCVHKRILPLTHLPFFFLSTRNFFYRIWAYFTHLFEKTPTFCADILFCLTNVLSVYSPHYWI